VFRGIIRDYSEEATTRGFPSPSSGGFGFVVHCCVVFIRLVGVDVLIVNVMSMLQAVDEVRLR